MPNPQDGTSCDNGARFLAGEAHIWLFARTPKTRARNHLARVCLMVQGLASTACRIRW